MEEIRPSSSLLHVCVEHRKSIEDDDDRGPQISCVIFFSSSSSFGDGNVLKRENCVLSIRRGGFALMALPFTLRRSWLDDLITLFFLRRVVRFSFFFL